MAKKGEATLLVKIKTEGQEKLSKARDILLSFDAAKNIISGVASVITRLGEKMLDIGIQSAVFEQVKKSFNDLARSQGQDANKMIDSMRELSGGTISDLKLMQQANQALLLGLPVDRFGEMLSIARASAKATGQSMDFMLNSIVTGLGRGSKLMLDNLGILVNTEAAYERYATSLHKTSSELTDLEKKQAFVNEALRIGTANTKAMGEQVDNTNDKWERFKANLANQANSPAAKGLTALTNTFLDGLNSMFDSQEEKRLKARTKSIEDFKSFKETVKFIIKEADQLEFEENRAKQKKELAEKETEKVEEQARLAEIEIQKRKETEDFLKSIIRSSKKDSLEEKLMMDREYLNNYLNENKVKEEDKSLVIKTIQEKANQEYISRLKEVLKEESQEKRDSLITQLDNDFKNSVINTEKLEAEKTSLIKKSNKNIEKENKESSDVMAKQMTSSFNIATSAIQGDFTSSFTSIAAMVGDVMAPGFGSVAAAGIGMVSSIVSKIGGRNGPISNAWAESMKKMEEDLQKVEDKLKDALQELETATLSDLDDVWASRNKKSTALWETHSKEILRIDEQLKKDIASANKKAAEEEAAALKRIEEATTEEEVLKEQKKLGEIQATKKKEIEAAKTAAQEKAKIANESFDNESKIIQQSAERQAKIIRDQKAKDTVSAEKTAMLDRITAKGGADLAGGDFSTIMGAISADSTIGKTLTIPGGSEGIGALDAVLAKITASQGATETVPSLKGDNNISIVVNGGLLGDEAQAIEFAKMIDAKLLELRQNNESRAFDSDVV